MSRQPDLNAPVCDVCQRVRLSENQRLYGLRTCSGCLPGARRLLLAGLAHVNAEAEAAMLRTGITSGAHHRAIEAELKRLRMARSGTTADAQVAGGKAEA